MAGTKKWDKYKWIIWIMYFFSPIVVLAFLCLKTKLNLFLSVPTWSDELDYWRELYSFSENGFKFGGSLFAGYEAAIGPLGAHSFSPIMVWGLASLLFPWGEHSILIINLIFLCVGWMLFAIIAKPDIESNIYGLLLAFLYPPVALYLFTSMIEIPLYAGLIVYSALFIRYMNSKKNSTFIWLMIVGIFCVLVRMPYIVILFPAIFAKTDFKFNLKTLRNMVIYVVAFLVVYKIFNIFCAGYPDWVTASIGKAEGVSSKLKVIISNTKTNIGLYFNLSRESRNQVALRYAYGLMIVLLGFFSFRKSEGEKKWAWTFNREIFSFFVMTGGLFAIMITLYDIKDWRDYRTFAPVLLLSLIFTLIRNGRDDNTKAVRRYALGLFLLLIAFSSRTYLTSDRVIADNVEVVTGFESLETVREDGTYASLATTFDINWKDMSLMKSVPSKLGFKVFYNNIIDETTLNNVDYILTTEEFVENHQDYFIDMVYINSVEQYGVIYRVR